MTNQVRWLHISDIHFRTKLKLDQNDAFVRISADLARRKAEGRGPDLIFVTGDIAHSGQATEYDEISRPLHQLCFEVDFRSSAYSSAQEITTAT
jgi:3',5'-cyclic AMP phosphodiesterase CpdA